MTDLHHEVTIEAPAERVFAALTTAAGLKAWWTADSAIDPRLGGAAEFGFMDRSVVFRMRIDAFEPGRRLEWSCVGGPPDWLGTTVRFDLVPGESGGTKVSFLHADSRTAPAIVARRNTTWGCLMGQLKCHVEGKPLGPVFAVEGR